MTNPKTHRRWTCPHCGWTYTSPIPLLGMFHPCPERDKQKRELRPERKATA